MREHVREEGEEKNMTNAHIHIHLCIVDYFRVIISLWYVVT